MNLINVLVIGLADLENEVKRASQKIQDEVDAELEAGAMNFVTLAKRDLASQGGDRGTLLRSISYNKIDKFDYVVSARTFYAAFIEFGTKSKFNPYPGTEEYASKFKGEKQSGAIRLIDAIRGWVKRKGIAKDKDVNQVAFLIARSIYKNGINPKPFFFKQMPIIQNQITKNIRTVLDGI